MEAKIQHFSGSKNSMIQSAVSELLNKHEDGQGLNAEHPRIQLLNKVLGVAHEARQADDPHEGFFHRALDWAKHLIDKIELKLHDSKYVTAFVLLEQYVQALLEGNTKLAEERRNELHYSECDPKWVAAVIEWFHVYVAHMGSPKYVTYKTLEDFVYPLRPLPQAAPAAPLRVGLIGDWGTGDDRALAVLDQLFALKPDVLIHVGDVYYSGTTHEFQKHYLDVINEARRRHNWPVPVYNLPGNHDYYSGGGPFYDALAVTNTGTSGATQEASYFVLANSAWHLQGMDTGYHDNDVLKVGQDTTHLVPSEIPWHHHHLNQAVAARKKIILLSHHQLFSRYLAIAGRSYNPQLLSVFEPYIQQKQVAAWFWGHEHLAEIYQPFKGLDKGRCVGHGAVPIFYDEGSPYTTLAQVAPGDTLPEMVVDLNYPHDPEVYDQGFVLLELGDDQQGVARYFSVDNTGTKVTELYHEAL